MRLSIELAVGGVVVVAVVLLSVVLLGVVAVDVVFCYRWLFCVLLRVILVLCVLFFPVFYLVVSVIAFVLC